MQRWNACAEWAERFRDGRVFLAGDAAHNMPPTGGFGGNVGVQDGAQPRLEARLVLEGRAGPGCSATYDAERRPVASSRVEQAYTRYVLRLAPELGKENLQPIVPEAAVELGYRYHSGAVVAEADDDGALFENPLEPTARPGHPRAARRRRRGRTARYRRSTSSVAASSLLAAAKATAGAKRARAGRGRRSASRSTRTRFADRRFASSYGTGADGAAARPAGRLRRLARARCPADRREPCTRR